MLHTAGGRDVSAKWAEIPKKSAYEWLIKKGLRGFVWVSPDGKNSVTHCVEKVSSTSSGAEKWSIFRIG